MQRGSEATLVFLCLVTGVAGRTTVAGKVDCETVVRNVGRNLDLSSVHSKWLNCQDCEVVVHIDEQSQGSACVLYVGKKYFDVGVGNECRASSSAGGFQVFQSIPRWSCIPEGREGERHRHTGEHVRRGQSHEAAAREVEWFLLVDAGAVRKLWTTARRQSNHSDRGKQCSNSHRRSVAGTSLDWWVFGKWWIRVET